MNPPGIVLVLVCCFATLFLPRRHALLPLFAATCLTTIGQSLQIAGINFWITRLVFVAGGLRVFLRHERRRGGLLSLDGLVVLWAIWALVSSLGHEDSWHAFIWRAGMAFDACAVYFLVRTFCQSTEELEAVVAGLAGVLAVVAAEMLFEKVTGRNLFAMFGGIAEASAVRGGKIRAQGPFLHAILAGTVGAVCLPLFIAFLRERTKTSVLGVVACLAMIAASVSSGPIMSLGAAVCALLMWRFRDRLYIFRWGAVLVYVGLTFVMKSPPYYLIARIDFTGESTGFHRAALIQSSIEHLREWWAWGTDYTRHWMPTGVAASTQETDITNQYIRMGVIGGLPLMFLFLAMVWRGFVYAGDVVNRWVNASKRTKSIAWALGASLFSIFATGISVSFFDQSVLFVYLVLGVLGSLRALMAEESTRVADRRQPAVFGLQG